MRFVPGYSSLSHIGSVINCIEGFSFDDTKADATSTQEMHRIINLDPRNAEESSRISEETKLITRLIIPITDTLLILVI